MPSHTREQPPIFEIADPALAQSTTSVLGMWGVVEPAARPGGALAFDLSAGPPADVPVWRANLPGDTGYARAQLDQGAARMGHTQQALNAAAGRLGRARPAVRPSEALSFGLPGDEDQQVEAEIAGVMRQIQGDSAPVNFNIREALGSGWEQARQQFDAILDRLTHSAAYYAWVETRVERRLQGLTTVDWTGQMQTVWRAALPQEQAQLHQRTLSLALRSRALVIQALGTTVQAAALISTPGGQIMALPVLWKGINQWLAVAGQDA
jgi:hypothetical protein